MEFLTNDKFFSLDDKPLNVISQNRVPMSMLQGFHTKEYLNSLYWSINLAKIAEFPLLAIAPNFLLQSFFVAPMHYQVGGTVLGGEIAMRYGWAISLAGGMHHASSNSGGGWCVFSDIPIAIKSLKDAKKIEKAMIIDLDVHQGNGHERDKIDKKMGDPKNIYILDAYNCYAYPHDEDAKEGIDCKIEYRSGCNGTKFLYLLKEGLNKSFQEFDPDIIFYNAGTDLLDGDPLGRCCIPEADVITRDEWVFAAAMSRRIPIVMVLSGGYQQSNARVIANSIMNLNKKLDLIEYAQENYEKNQ